MQDRKKNSISSGMACNRTLVSTVCYLVAMGLLANPVWAQVSLSQIPPVSRTSAEPIPNLILTADDSGAMDDVAILTMKASLLDAFSTTNMPDGRIRLAFQGMQNHRGFGPNRPAGADGCTSFGANQTCNSFGLRVENSIRPFEGTHRSNFYKWVNSLYQQNGPGPYHTVMLHAGELLRGKWQSKFPNNTTDETTFENVPSIENPWAAKPGVQIDPSPLSCRRAFHIFLSSGEWSSLTSVGQNPSISMNLPPFSLPKTFVNYDGSKLTFPDGVVYDPVNNPQLKIYSDDQGNEAIATFSDLAMYYWANDLQPTIPNNVNKVIGSPVTTNETYTSNSKTVTFSPYWNPKNNPADWQHMQLYTINFGRYARISWYKPGATQYEYDEPYKNKDIYDNTYGKLFSKLAANDFVFDPISYPSELGWPKVVSGRSIGNAPGRIFDMYHAALNTRGKHYYASDTATLTSALKEVLNDMGKYTVLPGIASATASSNRLTSNSTAYIAGYDYQNNAWTGTLKSVATDSLNGTALWNASIPAANNRVIVTKHLNGSGIPFRWASLTQGLTAAQITALNLGSDTAKTDAIRGLRLFDIVNSSVAFVGRPSGLFDSTAYNTFLTQVKNRTHMVYVGANDGMLHGFDAGAGTPTTPGTGVEKVAYIPRGLQSSLSKLLDNPYVHRYWVDGSVFTGEAQNTASTGTLGGWATLLVGTLGAGGKGYYVLNVSNPSNFSESTANAQNLLVLDTTDSTDADMGYQLQQPVMQAFSNNRSAQIVQLNKTGINGKEWAVILGNGYNSTNGKPVLLVQSLEGTKPLYKVDACAGVTAAVCGQTTVVGDTNGLSAPRPVDVNGDGTVDVVYAGDLKGNLWKFDLTSATPANWTVAFNKKPFFVAKGQDGKLQPITSAPIVVPHPYKPGFMVGVGTGMMLSDADASDTRLNTFYGLYDSQPFTASGSVVTLGVGSEMAAITGTGGARYSGYLYRQTLGELGAPDANGNRRGTSSITDNTNIDGSTMRGWYYDIPDIQNGNATKVLHNPAAATSNVVFFASTNVGGSTGSAGGAESCNPSTTTATGPRTQFNYFDLVNGNRPPAALIVTANGVTTSLDSKGANRFEFSQVTRVLPSGTDTVKTIGKDGSISIDFTSKAGRRMGWRIAR